MSHDFEIRQQCQDLYVFEGLTLEKISIRMDLPVRTVEEWSRGEGWVAQRKEYRKAQSEIRRKTPLYRLELLKDAMRTLHPQAAFAVAMMERLAAQTGQPKEGAPQSGAQDAEPRIINTPEEAVAALQEAISRRLNTMLASPDAVNLKAVRELRDALTLADELKAKYKPGDDTAKKQIDPETLRQIKEEIYGIG